jgi:hypothetical protein
LSLHRCHCFHRHCCIEIIQGIWGGDEIRISAYVTSFVSELNNLAHKLLMVQASQDNSIILQTCLPTDKYGRFYSPLFIPPNEGSVKKEADLMANTPNPQIFSVQFVKASSWLPAIFVVALLLVVVGTLLGFHVWTKRKQQNRRYYSIAIILALFTFGCLSFAYYIIPWLTDRLIWELVVD